MSIVIYKCEWTNEYVAYDEDYVDDLTPCGRGSTKREALEDLRDTMSDFLNCSTLMSSWIQELQIGD